MFTSAIPSSLADAYRFLIDGRAFVACFPRENGVHTVASKVTTRELLQNPDTVPYLLPECPKEERVKFLFGGIRVLEDELC